ncbi:MAG: SMR family transporter [Defluviitaleaceae bacterium]|nr:SMR family transporter [Defluviitaleaceae bacterium]
MIYLLIAGGLLVTGDLTFRFWMDGGSRILYFIGLAQYFAAMTLLVQAYRTHHIAIASVIMTVINAVVITLILRLFFGDSLSAKQMVGMALAIVGVVLLEIG